MAMHDAVPHEEVELETGFKQLAVAVRVCNKRYCVNDPH